MTTPEGAVSQAVDPFRTVDLPDGWRLDRLADGVDLLQHDWPMPFLAHRGAGLGPAGVPVAVRAARERARAAGATLLAWWVGPHDDDIVAALEAQGLRNEDSPGFEARANAMVLDTVPAGPVPEDITVRIPRSIDEIDAAHRVVENAFAMPTGSMHSLREKAWRQARQPRPGLRELVAVTGPGEVVGTASSAFGPHGLNLFGAAVSEAARGRGVYRALVRARWQLAADGGAPVLTVQAGHMSDPLLRRLGFRTVGSVRVFVDPGLSA